MVRSLLPARSPRGDRLRTLLSALTLALVALAPGVGAQDVGYSVVPSYEELRWDDAFGLEDARLPGVRLGIDFGPFFSLQPFYAWKDDVEIRSGLTPTPGAEVADRYDVKLFGAEFQVNFGSGGIIPFVKGGAGVLRTEDEVADRRDRILLRGGGGLGFSLGDRASAEIFGERLTTRLPSPFIPGAVEDEAFDEDGIVNSLVIGAGVRLPLGGGYRDAGGSFGILPGVHLEPFVSRIDFHPRLRLDRQDTFGGRVGIDLNRNVGLRGVYWRGIDRDEEEWADIEGYSAEFQFALNTGPGISPFLLIGGGRVNFRDDFTDRDGLSRDREDHVTLGGGLAFGLGDRTRIEVGARSLLMTVGEELQDVTSPSDLVSSWQYSAGLSVSLGALPATRTAAAPAAPDLSGIERELAALRQENERLRRGEDPATVPTTVPAAVVDTVQAPRTITVPVPEVGEIILRYGPEYARAGDGVVVVDSAALDQARLDAIVREAIREELDRIGVAPVAPPPPAAAPAPVPAEGTFLAGRRLHALLPYTGVQLSPGELLLGVRADLGVLNEAVPIDIIPDATFGFLGGSPTLMVGLNTRFGWNVGLGRNVFPYVEAGAALSSRKFVTVNLGYGVEFDLSNGTSPRRIFVQHRGVSAFSDNQLLVGIRLPR